MAEINSVSNKETAQHDLVPAYHTKSYRDEWFTPVSLLLRNPDTGIRTGNLGLINLVVLEMVNCTLVSEAEWSYDLDLSVALHNNKVQGHHTISVFLKHCFKQE